MSTTDCHDIVENEHIQTYELPVLKMLVVDIIYELCTNQNI